MARAEDPDEDEEKDMDAIMRDIERLKSLIRRHRKGSLEPGVATKGAETAIGLLRVQSDKVVPDGTNRERTGLSLEHIHYLASLFASKGFRPRVNDVGHDVPVYVHEAPPSPFGAAALLRYRTMAAGTPGYPETRLPTHAEDFFCSLGNGHFTQALNLFRHGCKSIFTGEPYLKADDAQLDLALRQGVPSLVLSNDLSVADRKFISLMLNRQRAQGWTVSDNGEVIFVDGADADADTSQFEALSKELDAEELSGLVRFKLGIDVSEAQGNYRSKL